MNTYNKIIDEFFDFLDVSEKTQATYKRALRQLFKYFTANNITEPSRKDILNFRRHLEQLGRKPSTIALYLAASRRFFTWTEHAGLYPNIALGVKSPKQEHSHKRGFFSAPQLRKILSRIDRSTPKGRRDFAIILLMSSGGLRTIEILRANISDIRRVGKYICLYVQGKGRQEKSDFVKIPAPVMKAIREYLSERGKADDESPLFASLSNRNKGSRLTTRTISNICKLAMRKAGFRSRRLTAHSLRHSAITLSLMAGISLADVQAFARHKNITTTMIYAHHIERLSSPCEESICRKIL